MAIGAALFASRRYALHARLVKDDLPPVAICSLEARIVMGKLFVPSPRCSAY